MASFMSLLVYGLSTCDCHILYRLCGQKLTNQSWGNLFGGGVKKLLRKATTRSTHATIQEIQQSSQDTLVENGENGTSTDGSMWGAVTSITKQRVKLNMKLLGHFGGSQGSPNMKEDKPTYREQFVPPEMSMVSYFMIKPAFRSMFHQHPWKWWGISIIYRLIWKKSFLCFHFSWLWWRRIRFGRLHYVRSWRRWRRWRFCRPIE